jgi:hypothetical protein
VADRADGNGQGDALQQGKVGVDVEPLGLETGKPADDGLESVADLIQMIQSLLGSGEPFGIKWLAGKSQKWVQIWVHFGLMIPQIS